MMSEPRYREWILDTIDSLRSRKARPDLERICRMVRRRHGAEAEHTRLQLETLIQQHAVLKVNYKGSVSYRNAAKVQRGRRRSEQAAGKKSSSSSSSSSSSCSSNNKRVSPSDLNNSDSAQGPMEDMEDELSTTAGMDSSMDEEEASLDAPCMQIPSAADSGVSLSPVITDAEVTRASPTPSKSSSSCHSTPEKDRGAAHVSPAVQRDTGSLELEAVLQPAAICPSAQRSALTQEEEPRAGENALTPDQLLSNCTSLSHQDEAVGSVASDQLEAGKKCGNVDDVAHTQGTETAMNEGMKKGGLFKAEEMMVQDLLQWSVADVVSYFTSVGFPEQAVAFRMQEIDGKSLLLMQRSDVLTGLSIRLGPALKIYEHHVKVLQRSHFQEHSSIFS
ncbi:sterile alpha motif domain containing 1a [Tachysurus vachellii]|uniref:sterile alpha motif domain containing 1a n=1 Tax=Tachysurus vachellii TaxID=175792 RepID=UPI00296ADD63|nr:sterile alpha motif domain containing 1a [Tachysurus vachellii]